MHIKHTCVYLCSAEVQIASVVSVKIILILRVSVLVPHMYAELHLKLHCSSLMSVMGTRKNGDILCCMHCQQRATYSVVQPIITEKHHISY